MNPELSLKVCQELDAAWTEYLDLLEKYQDQRTRTNFLINNGFMELTHSKYIMGMNKITRYQYDRRMQATTRVEWNSDALIDFDSQPTYSSTTPTQTGRWVMTTNVIDTAKDNSSSAHTSPGQPVRQRASRHPNSDMYSASNDSLDEGFKGHGESLNEASIPLMEFNSSTENVALQARRDPVNWFGVLAPSQLKNSQASFQQAVLELTTSANLVRQLRNLEDRILELQNKQQGFK